MPLTSSAITLALGGGKAANLARLARAGLPVPGGFVITTVAYRQFVAANGIDTTIQTVLADLAPDDPIALETASATIRDYVASGIVPAEIAAAIVDSYHGLGSPAVAVRSSATAEDLPDLSFAGQQDTLLNVQGEEALAHAVVHCWSSLWTARAIGYRARNGLAQNDLALAVVVQKLVPSEASGVLFTANPLTGKRHTMRLAPGEIMSNKQWTGDQLAAHLHRIWADTRVRPDTAFGRTHGSVPTPHLGGHQVRPDG